MNKPVHPNRLIDFTLVLKAKSTDIVLSPFQRAQTRCGAHPATGTKATEVKILRVNASTSPYVSMKQSSVI